MNDQTKRISTFFPRAEAYLLSIPKEGGVPFKRPASKRQTTERVVFILCATSVCESFCCILNSIAFCKALNSSSDSSYALANSGSFICSLKNAVVNFFKEKLGDPAKIAESKQVKGGNL